MDSLGDLYAQCFLISKTMDSPIYVEALRQAFIDAGIVLESELGALEAAYIPEKLLARKPNDRARKVPTTLGMFHHLITGIRRLMFNSSGDPLAETIEHVFTESHVVLKSRREALDASFGLWLPEIQTLTQAHMKRQRPGQR